MILFLDSHALFSLDGLVQTVAPVSPRHQAARELVDDDDLAVVDHVVYVALVEMMGLEAVVDQVGPFHVARRVETLDAGQFFCRADAVVGEICRVILLVDFEMSPLL